MLSPHSRHALIPTHTATHFVGVKVYYLKQGNGRRFNNLQTSLFHLICLLCLKYLIDCRGECRQCHGNTLKLAIYLDRKVHFGLDECMKGQKTYRQFQKCLLKVKKQKIIPPLVMVVQVSYIILTQGQEYKFHGMKLNIWKNNMHQGISQEKKNICNLLKKIPFWMKVPRRVILEKSSPRIEGVELKHIMASEVAVCPLGRVSGYSQGNMVSLAQNLALLHFHHCLQSLYAFCVTLLGQRDSTITTASAATHSHVMRPLLCKHYVKLYAHICIDKKHMFSQQMM